MIKYDRMYVLEKKDRPLKTEVLRFSFFDCFQLIMFTMRQQRLYP